MISLKTLTRPIILLYNRVLPEKLRERTIRIITRTLYLIITYGSYDSKVINDSFLISIIENYKEVPK